MSRMQPRPIEPSTLVALVLFAAAALSGLSCSRERSATWKSLKDYNLVIINIDALRADHLSCYGYSRNTSPFIDSLAGNGVLFERAVSNSSYTRESVATLMSGRLPSASASVGWNARPPSDTRVLGELFQAAGYATGFFSNTTMLTDPSFTKGFAEVQHLTTKWGLSRAGPKLSARALEFATRHAGDKFVMYLHYLDPHGPYDPPEELYRRFVRAPFAHPLDLYADVRPNVDTLIKDGFGPGDARFEDMVVRYDAEIADTDRSIGMLFDGLGQLRLLDKTLVVIAADHGEEFLDHGFVEHAWTLYDESLHIPLVLWAPGALKPARVVVPVSVVDILPSLLELMEVSYSGRGFDGGSVLEHRSNGFFYGSSTKPCVAELIIPERSVLRAVIKDNWKYIAAQKWLSPEQRPLAAKNENEMRGQGGAASVDIWGAVVHEELYDLSKDPQEKHNLLGIAEGRHQELRSLLTSYTISCREQASRQGWSSPSAPPLSAADQERLRSLGYLPP